MSYLYYGCSVRGSIRLGAKVVSMGGAKSVLFTLTEFAPKGIKGRNVIQLKRCTGHPTRHRKPKLRHVVKLGEAFLAIYDMI